MRSSSLRTLLVAAAVLGCSMVAGAHAENWLTLADACLDVDSVHLVTGTNVDGALVAFRASVCESGRPDKRTFLIGVRRDECPAILNGAASFGYFMHQPTWSDWRKVQLTGEGFGELAYTACRRKGEPDGIVVFQNELRGDVTVYVDGNQVCQLHSMYVPFSTNECDVDLRRFGTDSQFRHAVRIAAARGDVNDTVSISDCHWNWQGTKEFDIMDAKVHFDCM